MYVKEAQTIYVKGGPDLQGGLYHISRKLYIFFVTSHNFFFPFFCANNYYTSLLLIVCALR